MCPCSPQFLDNAKVPAFERRAVRLVMGKEVDEELEQEAAAEEREEEDEEGEEEGKPRGDSAEEDDDEPTVSDKHWHNVWCLNHGVVH